MLRRARIFSFGVRRSLFLLLLATLLAGCSGMKTAGVYNSDLTDRQPYVFSYDGSVQDAAVSLRNTLLPTGFSPESQDEYEGGASFVFVKTLSNDEKFVTKGYIEDATGTSTGRQTGKLIFLLAEQDGGTTVRMTSRLTATVKQEENAFKTSEEETESQVPQGHPLPMKYGRKFADKTGWQLESPSRAAVFKTESADGESADGENAGAASARATEEPAPAETMAAQETPGESSAPAAASSDGSPTEEPDATVAPEGRPGDDGDDVAWVQRTLNGLGMDCGPADGVMGPGTRSCIRSFQKANGLDATGQVDEATYERMLDRL